MVQDGPTTLPRKRPMVSSFNVKGQTMKAAYMSCRRRPLTTTLIVFRIFPHVNGPIAEAFVHAMCMCIALLFFFFFTQEQNDMAKDGDTESAFHFDRTLRAGNFCTAWMVNYV